MGKKVIERGCLSLSTMSLNHQLMVLASVQLLTPRRAGVMYGDGI